jgi:hypothetical protein
VAVAKAVAWVAMRPRSAAAKAFPSMIGLAPTGVSVAVAGVSMMVVSRLGAY